MTRTVKDMITGGKTTLLKQIDVNERYFKPLGLDVTKKR